jgi:hypothetical protein
MAELLVSGLGLGQLLRQEEAGALDAWVQRSCGYVVVGRQLRLAAAGDGGVRVYQQRGEGGAVTAGGSSAPAGPVPAGGSSAAAAQAFMLQHGISGRQAGEAETQVRSAVAGGQLPRSGDEQLVDALPRAGGLRLLVYMQS